MPVPTWDQYMAPSLRVLSDGEVHRTRQIVEAAADLLGLTDDQRQISFRPVSSSTATAATGLSPTCPALVLPRGRREATTG